MRERGHLVRREPPPTAGEFTDDPEAGAMTTAAQVPTIALDETSGPPLRPLPAAVAGLPRDLGAPPRLVAHLRAVPDVAVRLADRVAGRCPALDLDREAVLFGAATHDIGRTLHPAPRAIPGNSTHGKSGGSPATTVITVGRNLAPLGSTGQRPRRPP
jgi:hypothetical protein